MGSPTILYCGTDDCLRIPVLRVAGFRVASCASVAELERQLDDAPEVAAVLFEESRGKAADAAAERVRERSRAALVLFRHPAGDSNEGKFDLVVVPATPPARWLQQVAEMLLARVGLAELPSGWTRVARDLQVKTKDLPAGIGDRATRPGIQADKRRYT